MRSPDGSIEVVRKKNFAPPDVAKWCGWIEIPGRRFPLRGRRFTDPMVFSPDSRFLALTELTASDHQICRVVVLDFLAERQIIVYDEKSERIEDMASITSLRWPDDVTLRIGTFVGSDFSQGERTRFGKQHEHKCAEPTGCTERRERIAVDNRTPLARRR